MAVTTFDLTGTATTIKFPYPEWGRPQNGIDKTIDLFDFWDEDVDTVDRGINSQPLTLGGTVCMVYDATWENAAAVTVWLDSIKDAMNDGEEFTIDELGDCLNGVYVVKNFSFETIMGSAECYEWELTLERVRDL